MNTQRRSDRVFRWKTNIDSWQPLYIPFQALTMAIIMVVANVLLLEPPAQAANLSLASVRLDRMAAGTYTTFRLLVKPASSGQTSITINFNGADSTSWISAGGSLAATGSQTESSTQCTADGYTALGAHSLAVSSPTISLTGITAMSTTNTYCDDFTYINAQTAGALKTPAVGMYHPVVSVGSDSATVAVSIVTSDQILVTAVVPPTFTFSLGSNADTFTSNLNSGGVTSTNGVTALVTTNGKNGWVAWAKDSNTGLTSAAASKTIAATTPGSAATLSGGTEGYVIGITNVTQGTNSAGTTAPIAAYDATVSGGVNNNGSGLDTSLRQIAASTGTSGTGAGFTIKERTAITTLTPAANDYTDTITVIAAGRF